MKRTRITWILTSGVDFLRVKHDLKYLVLIGTDELNKRASLDDDRDPHASLRMTMKMRSGIASLRSQRRRSFRFSLIASLAKPIPTHFCLLFFDF